MAGALYLMSQSSHVLRLGANGTLDWLTGAVGAVDGAEPGCPPC